MEFEIFKNWIPNKEVPQIKLLKNKISWKNLDKKISFHIENPNVTNISGFDHEFTISIDKIVSKSDVPRLIIVLWEVSNNISNRIWLYAKQVTEKENIWKITFAQREKGKNLWVYEGKKEYEINKSYRIRVGRKKNIIRLKTYLDDDMLEIYEDSGNFTGSDQKYKSIKVSSINDVKVNLDDRSSGSIYKFIINDIYNGNYKLDYINIKNYRGIDDFIVDDLSQINIFTGRNNTCKSSILEAISLISVSNKSWIDVFDKNVIDVILNQRGGIKNASKFIKSKKTNSIIEYKGKLDVGKIWIYNSDSIIESKYSVLVREKIENYLNQLLERYSTSFIEYMRYEEKRRGIIREGIHDELNNRFMEIKLNIYKYVDTVIIKEPSFFDELQYVIIFKDELSKNLNSGFDQIMIRISDMILSETNNKSDFIYIENYDSQYIDYLMNDLSKLLKVIRKMREEIEYFEDIRPHKNEVNIILKNQDPLPLSVMGDGFKTQLSIQSALYNVQNGLAVIEEPESKLHPGFMSILADQLVNLSMDLDIQIFLSTHSLEFIHLLLQKMPDKISIFRMYRNDFEDFIDYEIIRGKEGLEKIEKIRSDLRGI